MENCNKALLFYNSKSGQVKTDVPYKTICDHFTKHNIHLEVVEVPKPHTELEDITSNAISRGFDLFGDHLVCKLGSAQPC